MYTGWLTLGDTEIASATRFAAYAGAAGVYRPASSCAAPGLPALIGDAPYSTPAADAAPWYDPAVPASAQFLGVLPLEVTGLGASTGSRAVTGGIPGGVSYGPRTVAVTALLAATSEAGLSYGLAWLSNALRSPQLCVPRCDGDALTMLAAPPAPVPGVGEYARLARKAFGVSLAAGPSIVELLPPLPPRSCAPLTGTQPCAARVEFTLVAADPFLHTTPVTLGAGAVTFTDPDPGDGCTITWVLGCTPEAAPDCSHTGDCGGDPMCALPEPPVMPEPPPTVCACTKQLSAATAQITVAAAALPSWGDTEPVLTIVPGAQDMRRLTVRFYSGTCAAGPEPCDLLAEVAVTFVPAGTTLVIDTRQKLATLVCADLRPLDGSSLLAGPDGEAFSWPVVPCAGTTAICVQLAVESEFHAPAASVLVQAATRYEAG